MHLDLLLTLTFCTPKLFQQSLLKQDLQKDQQCSATLDRNIGATFDMATSDLVPKFLLPPGTFSDVCTLQWGCYCARKQERGCELGQLHLSHQVGSPHVCQDQEDAGASRGERDAKALVQAQAAQGFGTHSSYIMLLCSYVFPLSKEKGQKKKVGTKQHSIIDRTERLN